MRSCLVDVVWLVVLVLILGCGQNVRTTKESANVLHTTASLDQIHKAVGRVSLDRGLKEYRSEQKTTSVNGVKSHWGKYTLPSDDGSVVVVEAVPDEAHGYTVTTSGEPSLAAETTDALVGLIGKKR